MGVWIRFAVLDNELVSVSNCLESFTKCSAENVTSKTMKYRKKSNSIQMLASGFL